MGEGDEPRVPALVVRALQRSDGPPPPPPPPPPSFLARVDSWWWGSGASLWDERRAVAPACRPHASTAANARGLLYLRVVLALWIFAASTQNSAYWLRVDSTMYHAAFVSNEAQWVATAYLLIAAILSVGTAVAVRAPRSALAKALLPRSAAVLRAPAPALLPLAGLCMKRAAALLLAIALTFNVVTTAVFWAVLREQFEPLDLYLNIYTHGVCLAATAIDFVASAHRLPTRLLCAVACCGGVYLAINVTWVLGVKKTIYVQLPWTNYPSWLGAALAVILLVGAFFLWQFVGFACRDAVGRAHECARSAVAGAAGTPAAAPTAGAAALTAGAAAAESAGAPKRAAAAGDADDEAAWAAAFPAPDDLDDAALDVPCELVTCAACATACPCCRPAAASAGAGEGAGAGAVSVSVSTASGSA